MFFLLYMYTVLLRDKRKRKKDEEAQTSKHMIIYIFYNFELILLLESSKSECSLDDESDENTGETSADTASSELYRPRKGSLQSAVPKQKNYGSFYLRMGAVGTLLN